MGNTELRVPRKRLERKNRRLEQTKSRYVNEYNKQRNFGFLESKSPNSIYHILNLAKLPKWCGERPGKKSGEPSTPEEENVIDDVDDNIEEIGLIEDVPEVNEEEEDEEVEDEEEDEDYEYE